LGHGKGSGGGARGRSTPFYIHRLVCAAFCPPPLPGQDDVHHIDANRQNNHYANLAWIAKGENTKLAFVGYTADTAAKVVALWKEGVPDATIAKVLEVGNGVVANILKPFRFDQVDTSGERAAVEEWRPAPGYPGYEISNRGAMRHGAKILAPILMKIGYIQYKPRKDMKTHQEYAHRLVALAFLGDPPAGMVSPNVDHINNVSHDNAVENLRWISHADNLKARYGRRMRLPSL
jgi:hypothetical protein